MGNGRRTSRERKTRSTGKVSKPEGWSRIDILVFIYNGGLNQQQVPMAVGRRNSLQLFKHESLITVGRYLITLCPIGFGTAQVDQDGALFALDIRTKKP